MSAHTKPTKQSFMAGPMVFDWSKDRWVERHTGAVITPTESGRWELTRGAEAAVDQNGAKIVFDRAKDAASFAVFLWKDQIK